MAQTPVPQEMREIAKMALSNILVSGKTLNLQWSNAFQMLFDIGGFHDGALDRQAVSACMHYITDSDIHLCNCLETVIDREEAFKERLQERGTELYLAVIDYGAETHISKR